MSDTDGQSGAEALDDSQLGADEATLGDEPSIDYPPDRPMGVDEPQVVDDAVEDSMEERLAREEPDVASLPQLEEAPLLVEDGDGDSLTADVVDGIDERSPEEAALHVEEEIADSRET